MGAVAAELQSIGLPVGAGVFVVGSTITVAILLALFLFALDQTVVGTALPRIVS